MWRRLPLIIFCVVTFHAQAQNVRGFVKDTANYALQGVAVFQLDVDLQTVKDYAVTNDEGKFEFDSSQDSFYLKLSFIGYHDLISPVFGSSDRTRTYILKENEALLKTAVIRQSIPVYMKGDTLVYEADHFKTGNERKLKDVLENMPGVEVENGIVKVEGKEVSKVTVEGKEFFDGDSKLAVENIPADAVDKIEVLKDYNEVGMMKGLGNDEDQVAINIRLKEGKKNFWFGDVSVSSGPDKRYFANPNIFYYSPKKSLNFIANSNNIGKQAFSMMDYLRFSGGMRNIMRQQNADLYPNSNDVGLLMLQDDRAKDLSNLFGALNFTWNPSKKWELAAFSIGSKNKTSFLEEVRRTYQETQIMELEAGTSEQDVAVDLYKISVRYRPSKRLQSEYNLYLKDGTQNQKGNLNTAFVNNSWMLEEILDQNSTQLHQDWLSYLTVNSRNILSWENSLRLEKFTRNYWADAISGLFLPSIIPGYDSVKQLNGLQDNFSQNLSSTFNHYFIINDRSNLNTTLGMNRQLQESDYDFNHYRNNDLLDTLNNASNNNLIFSNLSLALHYKHLFGKKFTVRAGLTGHFFRNKLAENNVKQIVQPLTDLFLKYQFRKSEVIRFQYLRQNQFANLQQRNSNPFLANYRQMVLGNASLDRSTTDNFNLSYFKFSMFDLLDIQAVIRYSSSENPISTNAELVKIIQSTTYYQSDINQESLMGSFSITKQFGHTKWRLELNNQTGSNPNTVNGVESIRQTQSNEFDFSFKTTFKTAPNLDLNLRYRKNQYRLGEANQSFSTINPEITIDVPIGKWFYFTGRYSYSDYQGIRSGISNAFDFLDATLFVGNQDKPWEFRLEGLNILDNTSINEDSAGQILSSTSKYFVLGRIWQFGFVYKI